MAHPLGDPKIKTEWMNLFVVVCLGNTTDQKQTWFIFVFPVDFVVLTFFEYVAFPYHKDETKFWN